MFRPVGQDFAAGVPTTTRGQHFLNTILDVCNNRGVKLEMGAQIINEVAGHHWPHAGDDLFLLYEYRFISWCNLGLFEITEWEPACHCWTQISWQAMQRDGDTADNGQPRIVSYCVKRSTSKSVALPPQVWKIHCCENAINVPESNNPYAGFFSRSLKIRTCSLLLEYVYADLWEHVFTVKA